jgi:hypothetical protein
MASEHNTSNAAIEMQGAVYWKSRRLMKARKRSYRGVLFRAIDGLPPEDTGIVLYRVDKQGSR